MDRTSLEEFLNQGLSLAEIGKRVGRHEATVAYWVKKHGLQAVNRDKHVARGGLDHDRLEKLVSDGLSSTQIANVVGRSKSTVRHWLKEYGLKTQWAERKRSSHGGEPTLELHCPTHGVTTFRRRSKGGYRCTKCRADAVSRRRRRVKRLLVAEAGGRCAICGYRRSVEALAFHHVVPSEKRFALSHRGVTRSIERARQEARKCVLLCANCHAEVEAGIVAAPVRKTPA